MQQFISDMENLHQKTKDDNFSIIIVDFESEDMDVEQALRESSVPRYVRLISANLSQRLPGDGGAFVFLLGTSIFGEKATLSAQQDSRLEWTQLRSETQTPDNNT